MAREGPLMPLTKRWVWSMTEDWIIPGQLFDGQFLLADMALSVSDGKIAKVAPTADAPGTARRIAGLVTPGFVDLQVNGGGGILLNQSPDMQAITDIAMAHRALGTAAIMPTVISDRPAVMEAAAYATLAARDNVHIAGLHIEGPHIDMAKRGTHDARYIRPLDDATIQIVGHLRRNDMAVMITLAPEAATSDQITRLADTGAIVSLGHSNCTADQANAAFGAGATCVTHLFNAMSQMSGRAPGLAGAAINGTAYVGMICDGVHVDDAMLGVAVRARPVPDRCFIVSDAMATVGGADHFTLYDQAIRVENGRLINAEGNLAGAHTTMAEGIARLVHHVHLPVQDALRMAITVPATLINAPHFQQIIGRNTQDIMVIDDGLKNTGTLQAAIDNHPT